MHLSVIVCALSVSTSSLKNHTRKFKHTSESLPQNRITRRPVSSVRNAQGLTFPALVSLTAYSTGDHIIHTCVLYAYSWRKTDHEDTPHHIKTFMYYHIQLQPMKATSVHNHCTNYCGCCTSAEEKERGQGRMHILGYSVVDVLNLKR